MISFIIPAYNEELLLGATLAAVRAAARAAGEAYEIVVADDASTDATAAVAERGGARVVTVAHRQIAATRNAGARAAAGDWFIFVDADTLVNEAVVRGAARALRGGAAGGGSAVRLDEPVPAYARVLMSLLVGLFRVARLAGGCFLFCTQQSFEAAGGFDEALFGAEELAMSRALKRQGRFVILREAVTTSGRKLRAHSAREILGTLGRLALRGRKSVSDRSGLGLWYGPRRADPRDAGPAGHPL
jgi:glycosyltransferase involved in cell wall biosynthesis